MKTTEERLTAVEATCVMIDEMHARRRGPWRHALWEGLYFAIPMLLLWTLGVDPATAARVAAFPYLLAITAALFISACYGFFLNAQSENLRAETANIRAGLDEAKR